MKHYKKQQSFFDWAYSKVLYDYKLDPWHLTYIEKIKKYVLDERKKNNLDYLHARKTLVDLGAGQGYIAIEMAKLGLKVIACDMNNESIKSINRYKKNFKLKNIKAIKCFVEKLPIRNSSVDFVIANAILEHIENEGQAINEWKRILKPSGRLLVSVPLAYKYIWPFFWLLNYVNDQRVGHLRRYDLGSLQKKFGMKIIHFSYSGHALKVIWAMSSLLFKTNLFAQTVENLDNKLSDKRYGSSNIIVVFEKNN